MKRTIFTILLFLLVGALANVAVAWACAARSDQRAATVVARTLSILKQRVSGTLSHPRLDPVEERQSIQIDFDFAPSYGWPIGCLQRDAFPLRRSEYGSRIAATWNRGLVMHRPITFCEYLRFERLPLRPKWPWFLINTLFYALVLWLLIPGPFVLRRHIRIKRGRCPKCGYDLRGELEAGCPECGWDRQEVTA